MKKIGCVIAYAPKHTNYGTSLVGYALIKKIASLGYNVSIINYQKKLSFFQKVRYAINMVRCGETKTKLKRAKAVELTKKWPVYGKNIAKRVEAVELYKERKLIPYFENYIGFEKLSEGSKDYDVVVVGSDQVWSPLSLPNKFFNLLFVDDSVRKVAYASSFGVSEIPSFQQKATGAYLDRFYAISVREQKGKEIVDTLSHQTATVVADPTLLLSAEEWKNEIFNESDSKIKREYESYIFCFFLGANPECRKAALDLKRNTGYKIVTLRHMDEYYKDDEQFGDEAPYDVDPEEFLRLIYNAQYVCTDSFHCSAFSIQFHKQFMTFYRFAQTDRTSKNSRIDSLFNVLGIPVDHLYAGSIDKIDNVINWREVDEKLSHLRNESMLFLQNALQ